MSVPSQQLTPEDLELIAFARAIVDANTDGEYGVHTMGAAVRDVDGRIYGGINLAVGNGGMGPVGPCGRDRQVLFDYHPKIRVILPTPDGVRSVKISDLMPLGAVWTPDDGTRELDPAIFDDAQEGGSS